MVSKSFFNLFRRSGVELFAAVAIGMCAVLAAGAQIPEDAAALFNKAQDLHEKGDLAGAVEQYGKAIEIMPEFPEAEYQRAAALDSLGKKDEALKGYLRAAELRPEWAPANAAAGALLVRSGKYTDALPLLDKALAAAPTDPVALNALTELRIKTKADKAVLQDLLAKITPLTTNSKPAAGVWGSRAALEAALGRNEVARASLEKALASDPRDRGALYQLAFISANGGDLERARSLLASLESIAPADSGLHFLRATIFTNEGNTAAALKELDLADARDPLVADLRSKIAAAGTVDPAELEKLLAADPKNAGVLGRLCREYRRTAPAKALEYCRRASEAEPNNIDHAVGFAAALVQAKQYAAAVDLLRKLIGMSPENSTAHANLATALFQSGRFAEAAPEYDWLAQKQPTAATPHFFLGIVHDRLGELREAMTEYQAYLRLADPVENKDDIDKVTLRLPSLAREIKKSRK